MRKKLINKDKKCVLCKKGFQVYHKTLETYDKLCTNEECERYYICSCGKKYGEHNQ